MSDNDIDMSNSDQPGAKKPCPCLPCKVLAESPEMFGGAQPNKKRYRPPRADKNTFATQQEFLDSLHVTDISGIDENDRKCALCRKPYGEPPDPGFDNSEEPVMLRCSHAFGDKCLQNLFGLPPKISAQLVPLRFSVASYGMVLGKRLHAYVRANMDKPLDDLTEIMLKLTEEIGTAQQSLKILGKHWGVTLNKVLLVDYDLAAIRLMENGLVFDISLNPYRTIDNKSKLSAIVQSGPVEEKPGAKDIVSTAFMDTASLDQVFFTGAHLDMPPFLAHYSPELTSQQSHGFDQTITANKTVAAPVLSTSMLDFSYSEPAFPTSFVDWMSALDGETKLDKLLALKEKGKELAEKIKIANEIEIAKKGDKDAETFPQFTGIEKQDVPDETMKKQSLLALARQRAKGSLPEAS